MWPSIRSRTRLKPPVGLGDVGVEVVGEADARPIDGREPAGEGDAVGGERRQVDFAAVGPADELQRWLALGLSSGAHLVDGAVERADLLEPPEDVLASVAARHARVAADGEVHVASGASQLVGELHAGGRGADDEHATVGELAGVAVAGRGELFDRRVESRGDRRDRRLVAPAGGDDHVGRRASCLGWWRPRSRRRGGAGVRRWCVLRPGRRRTGRMRPGTRPPRPAVM